MELLVTSPVSTRNPIGNEIATTPSAVPSTSEFLNTDNEEFIKKNDNDNNMIAYEFPLPYRCELLEWVVDNQSASFAKLQYDLRNETFRDKDGILRYTHNWLPAPDDDCFCNEDDKSRRIKYLLETGCSEISFSVPAALLPSLSKTEKNRNTFHLTVKILSDWERLWRYLALDNTEEMGEHAALLCAFIGFFMHERSLRLFWVLFVYDGVLALWFSYGQSSSAFNAELTSLLHKVSCGVFYVVLRRLYVDDSSRERDTKAEQENLLASVDNNNGSNDSSSSKTNRRRLAKNPFKYTLHWRGALRRCLKLIALELQSLVLCCQSNKAVNKTEAVVGKDLSRDIVTSFEHLVNVALKFLTHHCELQVDTIYFNRVIYQFTFLTISVLLPVYCICYLAVVWLDNVSLCQQQSSQCTNVIIYTTLKIGYLTDIVELFLMYGSLCVSIVGLTYGTELAYYMVHYWMNRYGGLRKVSSDLDGDADRDFESKSAVVVVVDDVETSSDGRLKKLGQLSKYLQTDAAEQYLFIVEYMRQSGSVWSPAIIGMYVYAVLLMFALIYLYGYEHTAKNSLGVFTLLSYLGQAFLFTIFPTWSLARANSLISPILELFKNSSQGDFAIIGR